MKTIQYLTVGLAAALIIFSSHSAAAQGTKVDINTYRFLEKARLIGDAINKADYAAIEREFDDALQDQLPYSKFKPLMENLVLGAGKVKNMGAPRLKWKDVAVVPVEFDSGLLDMRIDLDSISGKIAGLYFIPHEAELAVPEKNSTLLSLPFKGEWAVMWGGDTRELNPHYEIKSQHLAFDFNVLEGFGKSHDSSGKRNEDYFAFGKEIVAPAQGIVVEVVDGVHDNLPFVPNPYSSLGNHVIIKHSPTEFSVLAHLKKKSLKVKVGDTVAKGKIIGLCGNSGNSSEPELEYFLMNTDKIENATGIKVYFDEVSLKRKRVASKEKIFSPVRDDSVRKE
jgi:murein DD-endopeptidase MepM/ murein hydrolase activator NlpD